MKLESARREIGMPVDILYANFILRSGNHVARATLGNWLKSSRPELPNILDAYWIARIINEEAEKQGKGPLVQIEYPFADDVETAR